MSVRLEKCPVSGCGETYIVERYSRAFGPGEEAGRIVFPCCGQALKGAPEYVYKVKPLPADWKRED